MINRVRTFESVRDDLLGAVTWVQEVLGRELHRESRAQKYLRDINALSDQWRNDGGQDLVQKKSLPGLLNALTEADTIGQVAKAVQPSGGTHADVAATLFDALQGPQHQDQETAGNNAARNLFFELRILAFCLGAGLPAKSDLHPDVLVEVDGKDVHIECKRFFGPGNINQLVASAQKQLRRQLDAKAGAVGIIALDFSRLVELTRPYVDLHVASDWVIATKQTNASIRQQYEPAIRRELANKDNRGIQGLLYFYHRATFNHSTRMFGTAYAMEVIPLGRAVFTPATLQKFHRALEGKH